MVTFTRLLVISIVASVRSLSLRSFTIFSSAGFLSSSSSLRSVGDSEKNAISDPEAKPEAKRSRHAKRAAKISPNPKGFSCTSLNSC